MIKKSTFMALALVCLFGNVALAAPSKEKPSVLVDTVRNQPIFDSLSYPARVNSSINATVLSDTDGVVQSFSLNLGDPVKSGSPVAKIKNVDPVYNYRPVTVAAPVTGVISEILVTPGSRVRKGEQLAQIISPNKIKVSVEIASTDLNLFKKGMTGELVFPGDSEASLVQIIGISPFVDPATGTATTELKITKKNRKIFPGQVGRVMFRVREHKGVQIPQDAVVYREEKTFLRTVKEGTASLVPVELGPTRRGIVEILSGIEDGTDVIVRANEYIGDGESVNVERIGPPPAQAPAEDS